MHKLWGKPFAEKKGQNLPKLRQIPITITIYFQNYLVLGLKEAPRHEVVKQMWAYIKENKLQDPKNKQWIICDEKLDKVIGEKKFKGFGMAKYLKDHMS